MDDEDAAKASAQVVAALNDYCTTSISDLLSRHTAKGEAEGEPEPEHLQKKLLALFRAAAELVPAFSDMLAEAGVSKDEIVTVSDIRKKVPLMDKEYLKKYSLPQRCIGGAICVGDVDFCHVSSGSSGEPTFWARSALSEIAIAARFEQVLSDNFGATRKSILAVNVFPLGSWVGGIFTTFCLRYCAMKGLKVVMVTPGNVPPEILRCIRHLAPMFDRTCILGYPPFVKGLVDAGRVGGLEWGSLDVCMVLAGEVFSEEWRTLVAERAGIHEPLRDVVSIYGTADAGVLGNETWLSASIRRFLSERPEIAKELFDKERLPSLLQYDPHVRYIEVTTGKTLVITNLDSLHPACPSSNSSSSSSSDAAPRAGHISSDGTLLRGPPPLVRYHIHDRGGTMSYQQLLEFVTSRGFQMPAHVRDEHVPRVLPFVWVFGREHWAVSLYGANVFVDQVMVALELPPLSERVTGKFILDTQHDADSNPRLLLDVECAPLQSPDDTALAQDIQQSVTHQILRVNSEFAHYVPENSQAPVVVLQAYGAPALFPLGVKHKWTR